jgi:hypothetical protein
MKKLKSAAAVSPSSSGTDDGGDLLSAIRNKGGTGGLAHREVAAAPEPEDDPNDLLAAIRRAGNRDQLKHVDHESVGRERVGTKSLSTEGNTLASALAQLRYQVADSDSDDDDDEISDDEWD